MVRLPPSVADGEEETDGEAVVEVDSVTEGVPVTEGVEESDGLDPVGRDEALTVTEIRDDPLRLELGETVCVEVPRRLAEGERDADPE